MTRIMKDSGIPYIGIMPEEWQLLRGKYVLTKLQRPVKKEDGIVTCFRDGEVTLRSNRREDGFTMSDKEIGYQGVDIGDLVVHGMDGFAGAIGISDSRGKASPVLNVLDSVHDKRFIKYYLRSMAYGDVFIAWSTGIRVRSCDLGWNKLSELKFIIPTISEQHRIADYLDKKCASIDAAIEAGEKDIEKLKAYKQTIITNAVTQGIDSSVVTSNKTNTLFGSIRSVYQIKPLKHCCKIVSGATPDSSVPGFWDGDVVWITPADFKTDDYYVTEGERKITLAGYKSCGTKMVPQGSVVFSKRAPIGTVAVTSGELCTNQGCLSCIPFGNYDSKYLYYALRICAETFNVIGRGTTFKEISAFDFSNFKIPVPDYTEQIMISAYLDEKCINIDRALASKQKIVEKLKAYKKSLIYTYVTGKKEVTNG